MTTIPGLLREAARRYKDRPALVAADGPTSFAALDREADRVARALLADGVRKGGRIGVWAPNMWEWVAAAAGAQRIGAVIAPLNTRLRGGEVADIVRRAGLTHVFSIGDFLGRHYPEMLRPELMPDLRRVIVFRADKTKLESREEAWNDFLRRGASIEASALAEAEARVGPDDLADIMFTSGTTGLPKGALFDHKRSLGGARAWRDIASLTAADRYCVFGPFSHNASYKAGWVAGLMTGATIYWPDAYDGEAILRLIAENKITVMPAPPTVWQEVLDHPRLAEADISSLRYLSTGATTIPIELMRRLRRETDITVLSTGYGMTECCGSATHTLPDDDIERVANTVGKPIAGTEILIIDNDGRVVEAGTPGEVLIRDDKLLIEYLDNPEATKSAFNAEGWLRSGDVGVLDERGYLRITDRLKDMYIVGGFNVYPAEIERQMSAIEGLRACAVIGVPDRRLGEVGHVFIVRAAGSTLTEADVIDWSRKHLANYKIPRGVTFVDALPTNSTGKVVKFMLKTMI